MAASPRYVPSPDDPAPRTPLPLVTTSLMAATIQGICALFMAANKIALVLGFGGLAVSGATAFAHTDPVRYTFMALAAITATLTLYVLWNGWRLRNHPAAQWRRRPLTRRERWHIGLALTSSVVAWGLIVAEVFTHRMLHPN